ncbi:MAG: endonuclease/exonuclease/phosphatase family protein [Carboxylicivirga sp.]|nr:endonuclease/exonuclease/phosphatase family protein [Carboxylicivirga sp.]
MRHLTILLCFCLFSLAIAAQKKDSELKVISYNIWNGFDWGKDTERKESVIQWIRSQQSDVVALQELCGYNQEKLLKDAKAWGHSYAEILKTGGYPVGITSTKPIDVKERLLENMHHGALHCKTHGIDFMVVHFSPFSHVKRHEEAGIILSKLNEIRKQQNKYIVLGDFNAVSPFDAEFYKGKDAMMEAMEASEEEHAHVRNLLNGELEYGAIAAYLGFPLIDVVQKYTNSLDERISCPTQVFEKEKGEGRHINSKRIDYILVSPGLTKDCKNAFVANKADTWYLSDHYPVVAEF